MPPQPLISLSFTVLLLVLIFLDKRSLRFRHTVAVRIVLLSAGSDRGCEILEDIHGRIPVNAGIGDADALLQTSRALRRHLLVAFVDVGLDHHTNNGFLSLFELVSDDLGDLGLVSVVLVRVTCLFVSFSFHCNSLVILLVALTMRAVNHNGQLLPLLDQRLLGSLNTVLVVVGTLGTTPKDDESMLVT